MMMRLLTNLFLSALTLLTALAERPFPTLSGK